MDGLLPPIMQRSPIWPSSFPKVLSIGAILFALIIVLGLEKSPNRDEAPDINLKRFGDYQVTHALILIGLMIAYALLLRPLGFIASTFLFLFAGSFTLGERKYVTMAVVALIATLSIWYLVDSVLGIFLRPLPLFMMGS